MKKRVLFVSQEVTPYLPESEIANIGRYLPQGIQESGKEIRTFMPRYGCINERRNQLHEVIRLSGMNLVIDDQDHPLIIKVASIQPARMQVYFIDNEEYFQRKAVLTDAEENFFNDNDERSIFFCRGVIETVKKLGWAPDVIHCHGWMTALLPMYIKTAYKDDPLFSDAKIVFSAYEHQESGDLDAKYGTKAIFEGVSDTDVSGLNNPTINSAQQFGMDWADGVIAGSEKLPADVQGHLDSLDKPKLAWQNEEQYVAAYNTFYDEILEDSNVLAE